MTRPDLDTDFDRGASFTPDAELARALAPHLAGCRCALHGRRLFTGALLGLAASAGLADGVTVGPRSTLGSLVPAEQIEAAAAQQYRQMLMQALNQKALGPDNNAQVIRLRTIAQRIVPFIGSPNLHTTPRAATWKWEVNLIRSDQINAFCMPGGKIAFFTGILQKLKLTDDEVAMVMGHEIAHALREHARARMGKQYATNGVIGIGAAVLGLGNAGRYIANMGAQLLTLQFSRGDESEADKIGLDLAARAGYDPVAGISLWEKMGVAAKGAPPQWLSTHPAGATRIQDIRANLPAVDPLYRAAAKPQQRFDAMKG
jgi:predicted Zn-dependent protease